MDYDGGRLRGEKERTGADMGVEMPTSRWFGHQCFLKSCSQIVDKGGGLSCSFLALRPHVFQGGSIPAL